MVNSPGRQRRRPIRSNTIIVRVSTVHASRRSRNAAARSNRRREAAEQADIDEAIQLGQRLGIILPQTATGIQAAPPSNTENRQEPLFGSYFDADIRDEWADSPIATHAEYFRLRRYAERPKHIKLDNPAANPSTNLSRCVCASKDISERRVDMIDIIHRHGGLLVKFCKCTPDVIRLIHYGYFACSADEPRTAFSIRLVQYHHFLWQASAVPASAFIESLSSFLDTRTTSPLFNRGSNHKRRELRVPFTLCIDLYNRILNKSRKIYEDGLRFTSIDKWASKCPQCFGPILNEVRNPGEATVHLSMDGNFQQRHYAHSSKDCPVEDQYPELFLRPSKITTDIEQLAATDAVATGINLTSSTADWLSKKSSDCTETIKSSASILRQLHALPNPTTPGTNYTNTFFERQWDLERNYHLNINQTREKARQELGHLLCLQESWMLLCVGWQPRLNRPSPEPMLVPTLLSRFAINVSPLSDLLWKVWYSKINIRQQFLALAEERQPLRQACRIGEHTTLGTRASTQLMDSVRDRGRALHAAVDAYTARVLAFRAACPTRHAPPTMTYAELLRLQPDDPFWNDGLFTNGNEPWAIDANTQRGIRFLASLKRGEEEHRRLGWEVRRAMCWATSRHDAIWGTMRTMAEARHVNTTPLPQAVLPLFMVHRVGCAGVVDVVHARLIELARLQVEWDGKIVEVFEQTPPQAGDHGSCKFLRLLGAMRNGHLSGIPGDIHEQLLFPNGRPRSPSPEDHESDSDTHGNRHNSSDEAELVGHPDEGNDNIENRPEDDDDEDEDIEPLFQQLMDEVLLDNLTRATS
ncbi:hypothetical protein PSHT_08992, partial [Puccinia striiformis]